MKYHCRRDLPDPRDQVFMRVAGVNLPEIFELTEFLPPVLNQGSLGSCVSNQVSNALRYCLNKEKQLIFQPSRLFIYYFGRLIQNSDLNQDTGLSIRTGIQSVAKYGACSEIIWPYIISQFQVRPSALAIEKANQTIPKFKYSSIPASIDLLKQAIVQGYPVVFGMNVYESFEWPATIQSGNVPFPKSNEKCLGGHCVAAYGYVDAIQSFVMMNSWGESYGIKGFFYLPYAYVMTYAWDFWQVQFFSGSK